MSVITARALPDVYDGLKPVHRRILYTMDKLGLRSDKLFRKSAFIVGRVLGELHPHGDMAVYDSLVRMAQDFSLRYPLVRGQGNWGSVDGDRAASMRYTEAKLTRIAEDMLEDLDKETVPERANYDGTLTEPVVLPSKFPNLLVNGSSGIAVGMATNIPPHNLSEVTSAIIAAIDNPEIQVSELRDHIKGPDFPTGAIISTSGLAEAYSTGRGRITVKAKTGFEGNKIIITEIPYQVNKAMLIENIADLVRAKRIDGISDIRDESNKEGMRIVIQVKKDYEPAVVLNQLFMHTALKSTYSIIMIALYEGQPRLMSLKNLIDFYIVHRRDVVTRRTQFDLRKAEERSHILQGLKVAISNIDSVVNLIKSSSDVEAARSSLMSSYDLTELQASSILDMKLSKLTSLETEKINKEIEDLLKSIEELKSILASNSKIYEIIKRELLEMKEKYGDKRLTEISHEEDEEIVAEELVHRDDIVITLTASGYIKQLPLTSYRQQKRGGKGVIGAETKEEDIVKEIFVTSNHNYVLFFTNKGKVHWLKAYQIPEGSRYSKGKALVNILNLGEGEKVSTLLPIASFESGYLMFVTKEGTVKRTALGEYANPRKGGIIAVNLKDKDELVSVLLTSGNDEIILASKQGQAVRFNEKDVTIMGRQATGVRGMKIMGADGVVGAETAVSNSTILTVTELGYGKRTLIDDYRLIRRGGSGVINIKTDKGKVAGIKTVFDDDELLFMTQKGQAIRVSAKDISVIGRNTQGVRIMKLDADDKVNTVAKVEKD
ncbi:MAG: DNA gyrase subunit A, partial [Nanoarchaeota archaeon]